MATIVNINGENFSKEEAKISVFDRGFLFGDSVYEVLRTYSGDYLFLFDEHFKRLEVSLKSLYFNIKLSKERLKQTIITTLKKSDNQESYIRVIITRGVGGTYLDSAGVRESNCIVIVKNLDILDDTLYKNGVAVKCVAIRRNPKTSLDPVIKSGNYLNNFLALNEARKDGYFDGLMLNHSGHITEISTSNIFFVKDGIIKTPSLDCGILNGITRNFILKILLKNNYNVQEGSFTLDELKTADEIFMTSTLKEVLPITKLDNVIVGNGSPGAITIKISQLFRKEVNSLLESYRNNK